MFLDQVSREHLPSWRSFSFHHATVLSVGHQCRAACWRVLAAPECCQRVLRAAQRDVDITCICGSASSAAAVSHSWLGEAAGLLAMVYSFLRIHRVRAKPGDALLPSCHLFTWHMPCVCETVRAFIFFPPALVLLSGRGEVERWDALISASEKVFCIPGWLGNSLGDITPCLCRLIVCHGKAIHPYTTSFLPRLGEINFPFCLSPIETDPKHACVATHTHTHLTVPRGWGRREREDREDGNKVTLFSSDMDPAVPKQ